MSEKCYTPGLDPGVIKAFNEGNVVAFEKIHKHFFDQLHYFSGKLTGDYEEGEDIVSHIMAKLWNKREDFESYMNIKAFLYISTRNASLNFINWRKRVREQQNDYAESQEPWNIDTQKIFFESEILQALFAAIDELPERQREIIRLRYVANISPAEIANRLKISPDTVYVTIKNGKKSLKKILTDKKLEQLFYLLIILGNVNVLNYY